MNREMSIANKKKKKTFVDDVSDMDDEFKSDTNDFEINNFDMTLQLRVTNGFQALSHEKQNPFNLPEPIYSTNINIGDVSGKTKVQQICEQIGIQESEYVWYNSNHNIKVQIDPALYHEKFESLDVPSDASIS